MNARDVAERLSANAEDIAKLLLPAGKRHGKEWKVGSLSGEEGNSLSVCLSGHKAGVWSDFSTGQAGDLLDLWRLTRSISLGDAIAEVKAHFGVANDMPAGQHPPKQYARPSKPRGHAAKSRVVEWLASRGIAAETVAAFKIVEQVRNGKTYAVFPFLRDGEYVNGKYRDIDDKKGMRQEGNAEPCLFGWHLIDPNQRQIVITEGEIDAMTLHQVGIPALSVHSGAGSHGWIESDWERLERFSDILVAFDDDEAGDKGAAEVIGRLGTSRCRRLKFPKAKDANEYLQAGAERADFVDAMDAARPQDPEELRSIADFTEEVIRSFYPPEGGSHDPRLRLDKDFAWFEFRPRELTLWTGINGHGKSLMLSQVALGLMQQGERFLVFSGEMPPMRQLKRMVKQASGLDRPTRAFIDVISVWLRDRCWVFNFLGSAKLDRLLEVFTYSHQRYGTTHFVIDSLMTTDVPDDGPKAFTAQKEAMAKLTAFARKFSAHVHLVAHPRKSKDESVAPGKMDVAGSGHLSNGADNVFSVWSAGKDDGQPTAHEEPDARLELQKQRNAEGAQAVQRMKLSLWFDKASMQYRSEPRRRPLSYVQFSNQELSHERQQSASHIPADAPAGRFD